MEELFKALAVGRAENNSAHYEKDLTSVHL
jgi:hypothetical protein